ncbi:MAG: hypothetical protein IAA97_07550 [Spirochaetes bacterium]|uniref:Uncharacterized protein n=1 Tax=Candidatus Ornithospirochaeta stercoripullorum TaxID=2840899 RepID=A0A9D9E496_9SPIO|nr:hypothetical protein [Candidatus Ornithospirochaeta stercoripullorum]
MESFDIYVRSPFGKYHGQLDLSREASIVTGSLSFLTFSSDFSGAVDGDEISFKGAMSTPLGLIQYDARAVVSGDTIEGVAQTRLGAIAFSSKEGR